jgi:hypothetical protein
MIAFVLVYPDGIAASCSERVPTQVRDKRRELAVAWSKAMHRNL